ncbi:sigma-70 family RNA polymerase sigma factor [Cellvibrio japonicus]|nr:sigma-70 family RNA polymerase sigma factor [Cellvibrio japonicus]QEI12375.1 sigma-70 family RNA polymerase sigma factor [Cellvibrio japonicus]QEI15948.1 sigma-70 family RNA polymerase sigma factor [Cellvibrio japonicus]QEI19527.1 sigma-70 family RNA polymerase sigma factor [Cellvibrio japonicus]
MLDASIHTPPAPWVQIYTENLSTLLRFAYKLTGCNHQAEDMVQDAFFRLTSAPPVTSTRISSSKDQLNYLFQIIRNLAIDHYRKQVLINKHIAIDAEEDDINPYEISPQKIYEDQRLLEQLSTLLSELPDRTRYAFERHRIFGIPQKEIAEELGVSPTLVNFMIRDALIHCSKLF